MRTLQSLPPVTYHSNTAVAVISTVYTPLHQIWCRVPCY